MALQGQMWKQMLSVCLRLTFDLDGEDQQILPTSILVGEEQGRKLSAEA